MYQKRLNNSFSSGVMIISRFIVSLILLIYYVSFLSINLGTQGANILFYKT